MPDLPSDPAPSAPAVFPPDPAWEEAYLRVESYLRAHQLESRVLLNRLAAEIVDAARSQLARQPGPAPVAAALAITEVRIGEWFARAGGLGDWTDARVRARGRLAMVLADLPVRWSAAFLSPAPVPVGLADALHRAVLHPGPEVSITHMPPAPLAFGFAAPRSGVGLADTLRAAGGWIATLAVLAGAWAISR